MSEVSRAAPQAHEMTIVEIVATAIEGIQLWSRFNDWTKDAVVGLPIEICRYGRKGEHEIVVVQRFPASIGEEIALHQIVREYRARAAIAAMIEPTEAMTKAAWNWLPANNRIIIRPNEAWCAMIDEALKE